MSLLLNNFIDQLNNTIPMLTTDRDAIARIVKTPHGDHFIYEQLCQLFIANPNYVNDNYDSHIVKTMAANPQIHNLQFLQDVGCAD